MERVCAVTDTHIGSRASPKELTYSLASGFNLQAILVSKSTTGQGLLFTVTFE